VKSSSALVRSASAANALSRSIVKTSDQIALGKVQAPAGEHRRPLAAQRMLFEHGANLLHGTIEVLLLVSMVGEHGANLLLPAGQAVEGLVIGQVRRDDGPVAGLNL
jgi:hypothetical protein